MTPPEVALTLNEAEVKYVVSLLTREQLRLVAPTVKGTDLEVAIDAAIAVADQIIEGYADLYGAEAIDELAKRITLAAGGGPG